MSTKYVKAATARAASLKGQSAAFAIRIVVERSTNPADPHFGQCIHMFEDDAHKAAIQAARFARQRIDLDHLTASQERMLAVIEKQTAGGLRSKGDGWADWVDVYNAWDPQNVPPWFAGKAAAAVWKVLESRGLVEADPRGLVRLMPPDVFKCPCGNWFDPKHGRYGCPACHGSEGPAKLGPNEHPKEIDGNEK